MTSQFLRFIILRITCNALLTHFGALTEVHKHNKYKMHTDVLQMKQQGSIREMQFNTLKILATALNFISVGEFSQLTGV